MSRSRLRAVVDLVLAVAAAVGAVASWSQVRSPVLVAPILPGEPETTSIYYHPQWLLATLVLATVAGLCAITGVARAWRARGNR